MASFWRARETFQSTATEAAKSKFCNCAVLESGHETPFDTIGFKTVTSRKGPTHQTYTPVSLKGKASIVESIAAKA